MEHTGAQCSRSHVNFNNTHNKQTIFESRIEWYHLVVRARQSHAFIPLCVSY